MKKHKYYYKVKIKNGLQVLWRINCLLFIRNNFFIPKIMKQRCMLQIIKVSKKFSLTCLRKFCIITGRTRFILSESGFSRITFLEFAKGGLMFGVFSNNLV